LQYTFSTRAAVKDSMASPRAAQPALFSRRLSRVPDGVPRLDHLLARNLPASRSTARSVIEAGGVSGADGQPLLDPRQDISADQLPLPVAVEGKPLALHDEVYLLLHKPVGYVTALRDDRHPVAAALVKHAPLAGELRPVGRLDLDTSGLLLWTTSGPWLQQLTHPKRAVPRRYQAALARPYQPPPPDLVLDDGHRPVILDLQPLPPDRRHPALLSPAETTTWAQITLAGGAYHEVRRIFAALGSHVLGLCRVGFGRLALPLDLAPGAFVLIGRDDV
jgi:16S rRNA pseudouridine516 synthase